jgi:hypothetical protein
MGGSRYLSIPLPTSYAPDVVPCPLSSQQPTATAPYMPKLFRKILRVVSTRRSSLGNTPPSRCICRVFTTSNPKGGNIPSKRLSQHSGFDRLGSYEYMHTNGRRYAQPHDFLSSKMSSRVGSRLPFLDCGALLHVHGSDSNPTNSITPILLQYFRIIPS